MSQPGRKHIDLGPLEEAIQKQRLLFMALCGLNTPGITSGLRDDEVMGLTNCVFETIGLIEKVMESVEGRS